MRPWVVHGRRALAAALERRGDADAAAAVGAAAHEEARALGIAG
jgi:hypothetical protein